MTFSYGNHKGIGFFYPAENATISGIARVYGLAYLDEGWLELERGVGRVIVQLGENQPVPARTYVKNRYWIRTFDTSELDDGPVRIRVTAYDKQEGLIGTVESTFVVDSSLSAVRRKLYAAPDGKPENRGSIDSPWDAPTALGCLEPGDVLFLRGGVYRQGWEISKSGSRDKPVAIVGYRGEPVVLEGVGIKVARELEYVELMGVDQRGIRSGGSGLELGESVRHLQFWDCSFNDNTHPYEEIEPNERMAYGVGFQALTVRGNENGQKTSWAIEGQNRQLVTVSHCEAKYNDVDGFDFSSIDHGRFQFLEAAWNPNHKTKDIFQYKHADGFTIKNSEFNPWGFPSEDCVFLFCYSHHNGQDGFDLRSPHTYLFGCVSHDEAASERPFGGSGIKTWEYNYKFYSCVSFRNNLYDDSGYGLEVGNNSLICNCLFYDTFEYAITRPDDDPKVQRVFSHNNVFLDCNKGYALPAVRARDCIYFGKSDPATLSGALYADPLLPAAARGSFFPAEGSPLLHGGHMKGFSFLVDGVDYMLLDALGRPRASMEEIGPYTRYEGEGA